MKILLTGASGLIGRTLMHTLLREGHQLNALTRSPEKLPELPTENIFIWSDSQVPPPQAFKDCDAVIHLAGEGIADKLWTNKRKKQLWDSRVNGTKNIVQAIASLPAKQRPKSFISGSAIGFYGDSFESKDENSIVGKGFLAELCKEWESAATTCEDLGLRTVLLRTGLVLAPNGGLLSKMGPAVLGDGKQWMSWIHIEDVAQLIIFVLSNPSLKGPFNLTAENPSTNKEFTQTFSKIKKIPFTISVPAMILRTVAGELSQAILSNQKVYPEKATLAGYKFKFTNLEDALTDLIGNKRFTDNYFSSKQFIPIERSQVFSFFSKAENLEILTPPWLNFHIVGKTSSKIEKGTYITYKLKIHGVPVKWKTLIKEWNPDTSFVDFQLKGPYRKWHHLHTFEEVFGGTLISDDVTFEIPGGIFGKLLLPVIRKDVQEIFNYRQKRIKELSVDGQLK